jgi:hypothetical protein
MLFSNAPMAKVASVLLWARLAMAVAVFVLELRKP